MSKQTDVTWSTDLYNSETRKRMWYDRGKLV